LPQGFGTLDRKLRPAVDAEPMGVAGGQGDFAVGQDAFMPELQEVDVPRATGETL
jgi:hypothetical protein